MDNEIQQELENQLNQHPDYKNEIAEIVKSNLTPKALREKLVDYHENDIADALELLDRDELTRLFNILSADELADILEYTGDRLGDYFSQLGIRKQVDILSNLESDTAVEYLRQLSKQERGMLIDLMDDDMKREIAMLNSFDEDEIGSRMSTNYIVIQTGLGIRQAMHELVDQAAENDNISTVYVVDENKAFYGAVYLTDLIRARDGQTMVEDIVVTSYPYVYAHEMVDDCIERIKDYSEDSIPVLDNNNKLLGVVTSQDIVEIVDDEMSEDYARFAGLSAEEDLNESLGMSIKKRLPWLCILMVLGLVVSNVVGIFDKVMKQLTLLVSFQSLVLDMAGNSGTQSLAVTIRVLMDENVKGKQKAKMVFKEARVGLINGLVLGVASFGLIGTFLMLFKKIPALQAFAISGCIGVALVVAMMLSSVAGTGIPMFFKKIGVDPAVASGPLITTLNDMIAVVTYYGIALLLLINVMGLHD